MIVCRGLGRWPFETPPERATLAQVLFYQEAIRQLEQPPAEAEPARPKKRLKGAEWEALKKRAEG